MIKPFSVLRDRRVLICFLFLGVLFISVSSCRTKSKKTSVGAFSKSKFDEDNVADDIEAYYADKPFDDTAWKHNAIQSVPVVMQYIYRSYDYLPLWLNENGNTTAAQSLLKELGELPNEGINPERYHLSSLKKQLGAFDKSKDIDVKELVKLDTALTLAYLRASHDLVFGMLLPQQADSLWHHANDSTWNPGAYLANSLYEKDTYPSLSVFRSKISTYGLLQKARQTYSKLEADTQLLKVKDAYAAGNYADSLVDYIINAEVPKPLLDAADTLDPNVRNIRAFQQYYALKQTGKIDSLTIAYLQRNPHEATQVIDANLERLRWLPATFEDTYVLVNISLMELFLLREKQEVMHMRVIVGKNARQTPTISAKMANIVINPSWGVPPTIMKKDVLPGVQKSGSAYLAKKDLKVFDHKGNPVNPASVNASNYKKFVFRQPPGDDNALGYVKFNLPNKWDIYLHDTPHRDGFAKDDRAQSSGCIRVQQPQEMAIYILHEMEGMRYTQERLDSVIQTQKTRYVILKNKIPVHIIYLTAFEDGAGSMRFLKDFYKRDARLIDLLKKS